jgi:mannose-6-phosphate isomerase-like protein (cupin superfamily)
MIRDERHALVHVDEVDVAGVRRENGWHDLAIRFVGGDLTGSQDVCFFNARFPPGAAHEPHLHPNADELYFLISGRATVGVGDDEHVIEAGTVHFVRRGEVHWLRNREEDGAVEVAGLYIGAPSLDAAGYEHVTPRRAG